MSIWDLANQNLKALVPYEPGKPIEDVAREIGLNPEEIFKLASNENPLGPSPLAIRAVKAALKDMHLYPDGGGFYLRNALAKKYSIDRSQIILGCGSNEIIELVFHGFLAPGKGSIIASQHAFIVYKLIAQLFGVECIETPSKNYGHDLDAMFAAIRPDTKVIFLTNSNNPTGTRIPNDKLKEFIFKVPENIIIGLDEAYYEFLDDAPPTVEWMKQKPNLMLFRTFSKIHGLAALRIGFGMMQSECAEILQRARQPFNTNMLAQIAALAALDDEKHQQRVLKVTRSGKKKLEKFCRSKNIEYVPSHGNFVMIRVGNGEEIFQKLMKKGIIVRPLKGYHLPEWIRITIGTPAQMDRFFDEFQQLL